MSLTNVELRWIIILVLCIALLVYLLIPKKPHKLTRSDLICIRSNKVSDIEDKYFYSEYDSRNVCLLHRIDYCEDCSKKFDEEVKQLPPIPESIE